jgi:hypothetical protein
MGKPYDAYAVWSVRSSGTGASSAGDYVVPSKDSWGKAYAGLDVSEVDAKTGFNDRNYEAAQAAVIAQIEALTLSDVIPDTWPFSTPTDQEAADKVGPDAQRYFNTAFAPSWRNQINNSSGLDVGSNLSNSYDNDVVIAAEWMVSKTDGTGTYSLSSCCNTPTGGLNNPNCTECYADWKASGKAPTTVQDKA